MFGSAIVVLQFIWRTHKKPILILLSIHLLVMVSFYVGDLTWPKSDNNYDVFYRSGIYGLVAFAFGALYFSVASYVGFLLNPKRTSNWIMELPFSERALFLASRVILLGYSSLVFFSLFPVWKFAFWNWGQPATFFLILLPFVLFSSFYSVRSVFLSLSLGAAGALGLLFLLVFLSAWIKLQWQFEVEGVCLLITFLMISLCERKNPAFVILDLVGFAFIGIAVMGYHELKPVRSFEQAVKNIAFYPTSKAIADFKKYSTDPTLWSDEVYEPKKSMIYDMAQDATQLYLDDNEKLEFLKNVIHHQKNFQYKYQDGRTYGDYPISPSGLTLAHEQYILDHWDDSKGLCDLLPLIPTEKAIDTIFKSNTCDRPLREWFSEYYPQRNGPFEKLLESKLMAASKTASPFIKNAISGYFDAVMNSKEPRFNGAWLTWRSLTKEDLTIFRKKFREPAREKAISMISKNREEFLMAVRTIPTGGGGAKDGDAIQLLSYMCDFVSDDCLKYMRRSEQKKLKVFEEERKLFPGYNYSKIYSYYREVIKPENWDKLHELTKPIN